MMQTSNNGPVKGSANKPVGPTPEQDAKMNELRSQGYRYNYQRSISAAGVILEKGEDFWFFGLDGEIMHNPDGLSIKL